MSSRHLMLPFVVLGVLAVAVSGCGGDDDASGTTTTDTPAAEESTTTIAADDGAPAGVSPECRDLLAAFEGVDAQAAMSSISDGSNPAAQFQSVADAMTRAQENAPDEIAADLEVMSQSYEQLAGSADQIDWQGIASGDPEASAAAGELMQGFVSEDLTQAGQRVSDWLTEHCVPES